MSKTLLMFLLAATRWRVSDGQDICQDCDCVPPGGLAQQVFCVGDGSDKVLQPTAFPHSSSLNLIHISDMKTVYFAPGSLDTIGPVSLFLQNCSSVHISDGAVTRPQTLMLTDVKEATVGDMDPSELWLVRIENVQQLTINNHILRANYTVRIANIGSLTLSSTAGEEQDSCTNPELRFTLSDSMLTAMEGLSVCGSKVQMQRNTFKSVGEAGFHIEAESSIDITDNHFEHLSKKAFHLRSPQTHIRGNTFESLPAGALSDVIALDEASFTGNTIRDMDLGGVLLDMSWGVVVERNRIDCDCASKRTSILQPKDILVLTNSSEETLTNIFLNNYCDLNCTVTLKTFSDALIRGDVCVSNTTTLEEGSLCEVLNLSEYTTEEMDQSLVSAASRVEFLIPLSIVVVTLLITSFVCYGCREMKTFKFVFNPHQCSTPKLPSK